VRQAIGRVEEDEADAAAAAATAAALVSPAAGRCALCGKRARGERQAQRRDGRDQCDAGGLNPDHLGTFL